jgi:toxin-antitoxin system PIN domain toxin
MGVCDLVMNGFVRIVTNPKVFREPTSTSDALRFVEQLRASPSFLRSEPSSAVWDRFADLASSIGARGNAITDTYLAAAATDLNATLVTADRGFSRFDGLRWAHPLN